MLNKIFPFLLLVSTPALAQHITVDGSLSPAQTLAGPNYSIAANLGKQLGGNLFHSFGKFGLTNGESALFSGPGTVHNVIGRVTGGDPSSINGKIQSNINGANLYLINPSGVVFGPNASVNVSGSFYSSTADYLKMSDGTRFQATNPSGSTLSAAPPAAFGFLNPRSAAITVNGSLLEVPGQLGLVGGPVKIKGGTLFAPAGTINVTSTASPGEVPVDPRSNPTVTNYGPVKIKENSLIDVSSLGPAGSVFIRAGNLTIDSSEIAADNRTTTLGQIVLQTGKTLLINNGSFVHAEGIGIGHGGNITFEADAIKLLNNSDVVTDTFGSGPGGNLVINANSIDIESGGEFSSSARSTGSAGSITINIAGDLQINNGSSDDITGVLATSLGTGIGSGKGGSVGVNVGGQITVRADNGELAEIGADTFGPGDAGSVTVNAGKISLSGGTKNAIGSIAANSYASGNGGQVFVHAGEISIDDGAEISSNTSGNGNAGNINVDVTGLLTLTGGAEEIATISADSLIARGNAGNITVNAGTLSVVSGGEVSSNAGFGSGRAGSVTVNINGLLTIDGAPKGIALISAFSTLNFGNSGDLNIKAANAIIENGGEISTNTVGSRGNSGNINLTVPGDLYINDGSILSNTSALIGVLNTGNAGNITISAGSIEIQNFGLISTNTSTSGNGGTERITANSLSISSDGGIVSNTFGLGHGGDVFVSADHITINGVTGLGAGLVTGIAANAEKGIIGNAGNVVVNAGGLTILNNGEIAGNTFGTGSGGNVAINADHLMIVGASDGFLTGIAASAEVGHTGDAGSVDVNVGDLTIGHNGEIQGNTFGTGNGGNVFITVAGPLTIDGSSANPKFITGIDTQTNAASTGNAGRIQISAGSLLIENLGKISNRTFGSGPGGDITINVNGPIVMHDEAQITAQTFGPSNAGSIVLTAASANLSNNSAITTEATAKTGNGGNITMQMSDFIYLTNSEITTSVKGETGNGGNINISDPQAIVLNSGEIIAQAIEGHGGNISISTGAFVATPDSLVSATSEKGVSGVVQVNGIYPPTAAFVVLSTTLQNRTAVLRQACAARGNQSSLVQGGRGGLPENANPEASLPALYIAGRDLAPSQHTQQTQTNYTTAQETTLHLTIHCNL